MADKSKATQEKAAMLIIYGLALAKLKSSK